jgi:hypothetical protein
VVLLDLDLDPDEVLPSFNVSSPSPSTMPEHHFSARHANLHPTKGTARRDIRVRWTENLILPKIKPAGSPRYLCLSQLPSHRQLSATRLILSRAPLTLPSGSLSRCPSNSTKKRY